MKILAVGDIVGENGVKKLKEILLNIRKENNIDFVIVNAENSAGGMGITTKIFNDLKQLNVDCITMGNHTWGKKDIFTFIDDSKIIRPANYSKGVVGKGYNIYECKNKKVCVINLIGRTDMSILSENPFTVVQEIIEKVKDKSDKKNCQVTIEPQKDLSKVSDSEKNTGYMIHQAILKTLSELEKEGK